MGPGHLGIGLAAKSVATKVPLWVLLVASELLDLLSGVLIALGIERMAQVKVSLRDGMQVEESGSTPWSHGLLPSIGWSALAGGLATARYRDRWSGVMVGVIVFSHWLLDLIVHPPDLPLFTDRSKEFGLGLWLSGPGLIISFFLEVALVAGGLIVYLRNRREKSLRKEC